MANTPLTLSDISGMSPHGRKIHAEELAKPCTRGDAADILQALESLLEATRASSEAVRMAVRKRSLDDSR